MMVEGLKVRVTRKTIKNIYLRIKPPDGHVEVSAPKYFSDEDIRSFILLKMPWILKNQGKVRQRFSRAEKMFVSGEIHYLWGRGYPLSVRERSGAPSVFLEDDKIILSVASSSEIAKRKAVMDQFYRKELERMMRALIPVCEMKTRQRAREWRIRDMKTRWGSVNTAKGRIWMNLKLAQYPPDCLEYVMIHELVHFYEHFHNDVFYRYMDRFCPDWRKQKDQLTKER